MVKTTPLVSAASAKNRSSSTMSSSLSEVIGAEGNIAKAGNLFQKRRVAVLELPEFFGSASLKKDADLIVLWDKKKELDKKFPNFIPSDSIANLAEYFIS